MPPRGEGSSNADDVGGEEPASGPLSSDTTRRRPSRCGHPAIKAFLDYSSREDITLVPLSQGAQAPTILMA
jgi:hypothetical protein